MKILVAALAVMLVLRGLVHLMGTVTYMKLGVVQGLTFKTTLLGGQWDIGENGIRAYGALWAVAAVGFVIAALALLLGWDWWKSALTLTAAFSLALTVLDWKVAFAGVILNVVILAWLFFISQVTDVTP